MTSDRDNPQLNALFVLLDDPDETVQTAVRGRLLELGAEAVPLLRERAGDNEEGLARENAQALLKEIGMRRLYTDMKRLVERAEGNDIDLEQGAFTVASHLYPELEIARYSSQLDTMALTLGQLIDGAGSGTGIMRLMNRYIVDELGYQGARGDDYRNPEHSCMNCVMELRKGIPIALCVLYLLLARRLHIPLYGVSFPAHFLLKYRTHSEHFFIDPFNGGMFYTENDCKQFLESMKVPFNPVYMEPAPDRHIVARIMRNLAEIHRMEDPGTTEGLEDAIALLINKGEAT